MRIARHIVPQKKLLQHLQPSHLALWDYPTQGIHNALVIKEGGGVAGAWEGGEYVKKKVLKVRGWVNRPVVLPLQPWRGGNTKSSKNVHSLFTSKK